MNIFKNKNSFIGSVDSTLGNTSLLSIFQLANEIRTLLGKQGHLLDCYLSIFFEAAKGTIAHKGAYAGFIDDVELIAIFVGFQDGSNNQKLHPIYKKAQKVFEKQAHELPFQESPTKLHLFMLTLADEMLACSTASFIEQCEYKLGSVVDESYFNELYEQISIVVGEAMMDELNEKLKQKFFIASASEVFAQGMTNAVLRRLSTRDRQTNKQMFRLLMDTLSDSL